MLPAGGERGEHQVNGHDERGAARPSQRMKVTYIGPVPPLSSGPSQHGAYLTKALADRADVTALSWRDQYPRFLFRQKQRAAEIPPHPDASFRLRWWDPTTWWRAGDTLTKSDLVVLAWTTPFHALPYWVLVQQARPAKVVAVVHNAVPHEHMPLQGVLTRAVLSRCVGAVTHATTVADELAELVPGLQTVTTPMPAHMPVEPQPLPPYGDDRHDLRLLFFGMVRPYKGLDVALDALVLLRKRGIRPRLTVSGEFWDPIEPWLERIQQRGLEDQVKLRPGYVPDDAVSDLLAVHHMVLLPYRQASQSGIAPIALAARRPVVASAVGGLAEVVHDGVNGTLATPGDPVSLADAIARCIRQLRPLAAGTQAHLATWDDVAAAVLQMAGTSPA